MIKHRKYPNLVSAIHSQQPHHHLTLENFCVSLSVSTTMQRLRTRKSISPNLFRPNSQSSLDPLPSPATLILVLLKSLNLHVPQHYSTEIISVANSKSHFSNQLSKKPSFSNLILPMRFFCTATSDPSSTKSFGSEYSRKSQPIDAGSSNRKPISLWPGMYHSPATQALWEARSKIFEKPIDEGPQNQFLAKTPSQSRTSIFYNFSSDYVLREQYRNPWNRLRMGKLVEDLDALAGTIAFKHCCNEDGITRPLILVTASVDKMVLKKPILIDSDLTIVGAVTWVGRSSLEIRLELIQSQQEHSDISDSLSLLANFTFVARDSATGKSAVINQISPETEKERLLWGEAEERNKLRKQRRAGKKQGENKDTARLNALLAEGRIFSDMPALADRDSILMEDTCLDNSFICQPQQRNIYGRIFGGFLMRRAFELAFSTAYVFAGVAPRFVEVDHVDFFKPVDVGNFLRLKSCVLYTEHDRPEPLVYVEVVAHVTKPELKSSEVSNRFYFTFAVRPEDMKNGMRIQNVVPATEEEALKVLERMDAENCKHC